MVKPIVLGLIGGIASGKSMAAGMLRDLGAEVIDADALAHEELAKEDVVGTLARWWPSVVSSGRVDRKALAKVIFADQRSLGRLEGFLWPRIHGGIRGRIETATDNASVRVVVIDAPLLLESGAMTLCDLLVFIDAPDATRMERARDRGWDDGEMARREAMQWPLAEKRRMADHTFASDATLKDGLATLVPPRAKP